MLNILPLPLSLRATLSPTDELDQWAGGPDRQGKRGRYRAHTLKNVSQILDRSVREISHLYFALLTKTGPYSGFRNLDLKRLENHPTYMYSTIGRLTLHTTKVRDPHYPQASA